MLIIFQANFFADRNKLKAKEGQFPETAEPREAGVTAEDAAAIGGDGPAGTHASRTQRPAEEPTTSHIQTCENR